MRVPYGLALFAGIAVVLLFLMGTLGEWVRLSFSLSSSSRPRSACWHPCTRCFAKRDHTQSATVPAGYSSVDPWVISPDTSAEFEFLRRVFGANERPHSRVFNEDGSIGHVEVELAGSVLMMFDAQRDWPPLPSHLRVYVDNAAAAFTAALAAGAQPVTTVTELAFGERVGRIRDPQMPCQLTSGSSNSAAASKSPRRRAPKKSIMTVSRFSWPMLGIAPP
jgi:PhnB protein